MGRRAVSPWEPVKVLCGFEKISLKPGRKTTVELMIGSRAFQSWHIEAGAFVTDEGVYDLYIGSSLEDIRLEGEVYMESDY